MLSKETSAEYERRCDRQRVRNVNERPDAMTVAMFISGLGLQLLFEAVVYSQSIVINTQPSQTTIIIRTIQKLGKTGCNVIINVQQINDYSALSIDGP